MPRINYHCRGFRLGKLVSGAGMRYRSPEDILERTRRNNIVLVHLKEAGIVLTRQNVDAEFAGMVRVVREAFPGNGRNPDDLPEFLEAIQMSLPPWASGLSGATFLELFWRLVEARDEWMKSPAPPFEAWKQSPVAAEVDMLLEAAGGRLEWIKAEITLFETVAGFCDSDEDEKEEEMMAADGGRDLEMPDIGGAIAELKRADAAQRYMEEEIHEKVEAMDLS